MKNALHCLCFSLLAASSFFPLSALAGGLASGDPATLYNFDRSWLSGLTDGTSLSFLPDGRLLVTQKGGLLRLRETDGTLKDVFTFSVDSGSEKGLLNAIPQPDFESSHRVVVYWSRSNSSGGTNANRHRVSSFELTTNGSTYTLENELLLVENLIGPANHDGGGLTFGPDGKLFVGTGDRGCNQSPPNPPTLHNNLLSTAFNYANGKILRVNTDGTIPADNPFVGATNVSGITSPSNALSCNQETGFVPVTTENARGEIWALGLRNAFRIWSDPVTGYLWVGDVGEVRYEEINVITQGGRHMGYPFIEGPVTAGGWPADTCSDLSPNPGNCRPPAYTCHHDCSGCVGDGGCISITGGLILNGCQHPSPFRGRYVFGDYARNKLWTLDVNAQRDGVVPESRREFATLDYSPVDMEEGPDGALYVMGYEGFVMRISPKVPEVCGGSSSSAPTSVGVSSSTESASSAAAPSSTGGASSVVTTSSAAASSSGASSNAGVSSGPTTSSSTATGSTSVATLSSSSGVRSSSGSGVQPASSGRTSSGTTSGPVSGSVGATSGSSSAPEEPGDNSPGCPGCQNAGPGAWGLVLTGLLFKRRRAAR